MKWFRRAKGIPWRVSDLPTPPNAVPMMYQLMPTVSDRGSLLESVEMTGYTTGQPTEAVCFFDDGTARLLTTTEPFFSWESGYWYWVQMTAQEIDSYSEQGAVVLRSVVNRSKINPNGRVRVHG